MSDNAATSEACHWCGATPPCPWWQHKDPDLADDETRAEAIASAAVPVPVASTKETPPQ